jgi:hypothetical protein
VERLVQGEEVLQLKAGAALLFQVLAQLLDQAGVQLVGQVLQRGQFDGLAQELGVRDLGRVHPGDEGADLGENLHQPVLGQHDQAFPYRGAAHPEGGRQLVLGDGGARGEVEGQDLLAQPFVDGAPTGRPPVRVSHAAHRIGVGGPVGPRRIHR